MIASFSADGDGVRIELLTAEVLLHQRLVGLHDLVEQLLAVLLGDVDHLGRDRGRLSLLAAVRDRVRAHVEDVDDAGELVLGADRQVHRDAARGELLLDLSERAEEVGALAVEHVDEQHPREAELVRHVLHARRAHLEPHHPVDDDERALDDPQRAPCLALEARVARHVQQVDLAVLPGRVGERERDRHPPLLLVLVPVADRGAGVDRAQPVDLVGLEQQRLDEGRLAGTTMADDSDVADLSGLDCGHGRPFLLGGCLGTPSLDRGRGHVKCGERRAG